LHGLEYLKKLNIVHRDLKPYNILFNQPFDPESLEIESATQAPVSNEQSNFITANNPQHTTSMKDKILKLASQVKIIDFGLATYLQDNEIYTKCGTPGFLAPELFGASEQVKAATSHQVDIFAVGVMLYFMLTNKFPFDTNDHTEVYKMNKQMKIDFDHPRLLEADK
jgi:serine/threonine protein kinase